MRVLRDKVGNPGLVSFIQIGAFGDPQRDPRTRVITVAYLALVGKTFKLPDAAGKLAWFDIAEGKGRLILRRADTLERDEGIELAFDHSDLLLESLRIAKQAPRWHS